MFVPSNGASKSFLSSSVKLTLNEATSLNSRELLQIPFTEFLQILKRNLWAEINSMSSSKERSRDQVKKRTEENWFKMNSKWHDLLNVIFFKDYNEWSILPLQAVMFTCCQLAYWARERKNMTFRKLSSTRGKALRFIKIRRIRISLNSTRPKKLVIVAYYNNALYFLLIK